MDTIFDIQQMVNPVIRDCKSNIRKTLEDFNSNETLLLPKSRDKLYLDSTYYYSWYRTLLQWESLFAKEMNRVELVLVQVNSIIRDKNIRALSNDPKIIRDYKEFLEGEVGDLTSLKFSLMESMLFIKNSIKLLQNISFNIE